jgi:hypothetical protein
MTSPESKMFRLLPVTSSQTRISPSLVYTTVVPVAALVEEACAEGSGDSVGGGDEIVACRLQAEPRTVKRIKPKGKLTRKARRSFDVFTEMFLTRFQDWVCSRQRQALL